MVAGSQSDEQVPGEATRAGRSPVTEGMQDRRRSQDQEHGCRDAEMETEVAQPNENLIAGARTSFTRHPQQDPEGAEQAKNSDTQQQDCDPTVDGVDLRGPEVGAVSVYARRIDRLNQGAAHLGLEAASADLPDRHGKQTENHEGGETATNPACSGGHAEGTRIAAMVGSFTDLQTENDQSQNRDGDHHEPGRSDGSQRRSRSAHRLR